MRQTELNLSEEDRSIVEDIRSKGVHQTREVNRAHVLSCLDLGVPESQIMAVLGIGRTAVWRARAAYLQGGVELAVFDVERSGRPRQYDTSPTKQDYEYVRNGTTNLFVAVEPRGGKRVVSVTERRGKIDFVAFINGLLTGAYAKARRIHLVLDNLNTHFRKCFDDVLGVRAAKKLLRRVRFHYTPKHASCLNMAEIEIGILSRQCLDRRISSRELLQSEVDAWQQSRNAEQRTIEWKFTRQDADRKLGRHYVPLFTC